MLGSIGTMLTFIVWEVILHGADGQLLLESVDLVQEQYYASLDEPSGIADAVEQGKSFLHSVHCFIFEQKLIVLGDGDEEEDCCDIFEAMDPLLSF